MMTLQQFDSYIRKSLPFEAYKSYDKAVNGLQLGDYNQQINKIAFALDSSLDAIEQAIYLKCDLLFVHHGLFWGNPEPITNNVYSKIEKLVKNNISLYAVHLPLDGEPTLGLNAYLASICNFNKIESFEGIGVKGYFNETITTEKLANRVFSETNSLVWQFKENITSCAVIAGGASRMINKVLDANLDCFITGDATHEMYHFCKENHISVIAGGHYGSEFLGLKNFAYHFKNTFTDILIEIINQDTGR